MTYYEDAISLLITRAESSNWPELQDACQRAKSHRPVAWDFPLHAAEALGGTREQAVPAVAAIICAHMAIILIDDLLDEDPRGAHHRIGMGRAANLASGIYGLGNRILLEQNPPTGAWAAASFSQLMIQTGYGQDLDVLNPSTEEGYWQVAHAKSSPYFAAALTIGGMFGGANAQTTEGLRAFGEVFGEIMQIHDDLNDCLATPANVDWQQGRSPLPILFAQLVDHPEQQRFIELRGQVADPAALEEAQSILVSCGAISYSVHELILRIKRGGQMVKDLQLPHPETLMQILDETMAPVKHLLAKVGAPLAA